MSRLTIRRFVSLFSPSEILSPGSKREPMPDGRTGIKCSNKSTSRGRAKSPCSFADRRNSERSSSSSAMNTVSNTVKKTFKTVVQAPVVQQTTQIKIHSSPLCVRQSAFLIKSFINLSILFKLFTRIYKLQSTFV